jgi:putative component of membrane protein insertase Oxa1/YidC/SpoIIIJ protein YidD
MMLLGDVFFVEYFLSSLIGPSVFNVSMFALNCRFKTICSSHQVMALPLILLVFLNPISTLKKHLLHQPQLDPTCNTYTIVEKVEKVRMVVLKTKCSSVIT